MSRKIFSFYKVIGMLVALSPAVALAAVYFSDNGDRGQATVEYRSPNGWRETCIIPQGFPGVSYNAKDRLQQQALCAVDFYDYQGDKGMCPKIYSTSPGLEVFLLPAGQTRRDFERSTCSIARGKPAKKIAKYKQSITCSYTPSLLAYYHMSNILGGAGRVPPSVIRTMDKSEHRKWVAFGGQLVRQKYADPKTIIRNAWEGNWEAAHNNPEGSRHKPFPTAVLAQWIFTADLKGIYGALSINPRGESAYDEVSGKGSYEGRYQRLKQMTPYRNVTRAEHVTRWVPPSMKGVPTIVQMKDVSDMVILDTILNQQDRVGNIAYRPAWYYMKAGRLEHDKATFTGTEAKNPYSSAQVQALKATGAQDFVLAKEMVLKDNDCGVAKSNLARKNDWLEGLVHVSPKTYYRLLWFAERIERPEVAAYFQRELLFNKEDWEGKMKFKDNVRFASQYLKSKCERGELMLDLDPEGFVNGTLPTSCEVPGPVPGHS